MEDTFSIAAVFIVIFNIIILITFFNMASGLKSIRDGIDALLTIEMAKPENKKEEVKCTCGKSYKMSILKKGKFTCTECKAIIEL